MKKIFVLAEHRQGQIRDITFEMLTKGRQLADKTKSELIAVLLGKEGQEHAKALAQYAQRVFLISDPRLENFNSRAYQEVLSSLIKEGKPLLFMIGHTSYGVDLAPSLAAELNQPIATDCIDLEFEDDELSVTRQMYGGKVNVKATIRRSESYIVTIRQAAFAAEKASVNGEIIQKPLHSNRKSLRNDSSNTFYPHQAESTSQLQMSFSASAEESKTKQTCPLWKTWQRHWEVYFHAHAQ